jgi:putative protease
VRARLQSRIDLRFSRCVESPRLDFERGIGMAQRKTAARAKVRAGKRTTRKKATSKKSSSKKRVKPAIRKKTATRKQATRKSPARPKSGTAKRTTPRPATRRPSRAPASPPAAAAAASAPRPASLGALTAPAAAGVAAAVPVRVGIVTHYFAHVNAGVIALDEGELRVGDTVQFRGHTTDFYQRLEHMEVDHRPIDAARAGQAVGVQVAQRVREHDQVFRVSR